MPKVPNWTPLPEIDETQFKRAKNIHDFTSNYINIELMPKQFQVLVQALGEVCPFCTDMNFVESLYDESFEEILSKVTLTEHGVCPKCGKTRLDQISLNRWIPCETICLSAGQRSGKTITAAVALLYTEHRLLTLDLLGNRMSPADYFNLEQDPGGFLCSISGVSKNVVWKTNICLVNDLRDNSPWFQSYLKHLDECGVENNCTYYIRNDYFFVYKHKNLRVIIEESDKRSVRGRTRYFSVLDDYSWIENLEEATEAYKAHCLGMKTFQMRVKETAILNENPDFIQPLVFVTTSRSKRCDFAGHLIVNGLFDKTYVRNYATWEFNNSYARKDFLADRVKNAETAERDFGSYHNVPRSALFAELIGRRNKPVVVDEYDPFSLD